ncbi:MAG: L-seryl-tRNA(Sec) selenium transferase [Rhodospirillaceae bacterium]|nr:L-seryl-tRNA(Sec) selenium transferase [Rhodospirillaceae bacterium]|tara:strand:+ start:1164 stop:2582 length:1419 start_codon:yes stop_codon:yes gene_type:complete
MGRNNNTEKLRPPSVDKLLKSPEMELACEVYGRHLVADAVREELASLRASIISGIVTPAMMDAQNIFLSVNKRLSNWLRPSLQRVFNLTGTVLHTNLGRASIPVEAIDAVAMVATGASNLEYDLGKGCRGDRDDHIEPLVCKLTGADAATVVNNNAAAVLLLLNTLADKKEVLVSRGQLVEIGGSFRIPDIMKRAGCRLREVGTTNRTHMEDYAEVIEKKTALLMSVHTSNYVVTGFTAEVAQSDLAAIAHEHGLPYVVDLGSGMLIDMTQFGLPHEPTPQDAIADGADLVTFSSDKLLGGPQAGIIAGRGDLIRKIKKNPLKRALRLDKMTIAALEAVLRLYLNPDCLVERLPSLRALSKPKMNIINEATEIAPAVSEVLNKTATVGVVEMKSQVGSGSQPTSLLPSGGLAIVPVGGKKGRGSKLKALAAAFRNLPIPVIGRITEDKFLLDFRCLDNRVEFEAQLKQLKFS